ncbi:hypothetical protein BCV71DRAFT_231191 [Rhizopus microsporus]|uniref:Uncharacterized protein n=1 Tax=Rhizopus microsporus TaxID=58291 RepID=A0A1X0SEJ3_RHIZD|nr:hypothetical protein BCV71DRAFT_231191 [Rhizopus microsporus]
MTKALPKMLKMSYVRILSFHILYSEKSTFWEKTLYQFTSSFTKSQILLEANSGLPGRGSCEENQLKENYLFKHDLSLATILKETEYNTNHTYTMMSIWLGHLEPLVTNGLRGKNDPSFPRIQPEKSAYKYALPKTIIIEQISIPFVSSNKLLC